MRIVACLLLMVNRHVNHQLQSMADGVFDRHVLTDAEQMVCEAPLEFLCWVVGCRGSRGAMQAHEGALLRLQVSLYMPGDTCQQISYTGHMCCV
jgi:hypothetical protein